MQIHWALQSVSDLNGNVPQQGYFVLDLSHNPGEGTCIAYFGKHYSTLECPLVHSLE
jgi:hypothetical protein